MSNTEDSRLRKAILWLDRYGNGIAGLLIGAIFVSGLVYSVLLGETYRYLPDERDYMSLATHLARLNRYSLDGVTLSAYRPPGYPLVLSGLVSLNLGAFGGRLFNYICLRGCLLGLYLILAQSVSRFAGLIGIIWVICYPVLFYTAGTLYPQTLESLCLLLLVLILVRESITAWQLWLGGVLCGYMILTVPTTAFLGIALPAWVIHKRRSWKDVFRMIVPVVLIVGTWTARNYWVFGGFVLISTNLGENLLAGNSELTQPNTGRGVDLSRYEEQAAGLGEFERDRFYRVKAFEYMLSNPVKTVERYFQKLGNYFSYRNDLVTASEDTPARAAVMLVSYGSILGVTILRFQMRRSFPPLRTGEVFLIGIYGIHALVSAWFFTRIRFRLPFDYLLLIIDAGFVGGWRVKLG